MRNQEEFIAIFNAIPKWITGLNLDTTDLNHKQDFELAAAFSLLPKNLSFLSLDSNLRAKPSYDIASVFDALPKNLQILNLNKNDLDRIGTSELVNALQKLPPNLQELDLSEHLSFCKKNDTELTEIVSSIPKSVKQLRIDNWKLSNKVINVLQGLSPNVTELSLTGNILYTLNKNELIAFFEAIPASVKMLNLGRNQLQANPHLTSAISFIPTSITSLDLSELNLFYRFSATEYIAFVEALPEGIKELTLDYSDLVSFQKEELEKFGEALKYLVTIHFFGEPAPSLNARPQINPAEIIRSKMGSWVVKAHQKLDEVLSDHHETQFPKDLPFEIMSYFAPEDTNVSAFIKNHEEYKGATLQNNSRMFTQVSSTTTASAQRQNSDMTMCSPCVLL